MRRWPTPGGLALLPALVLLAGSALFLGGAGGARAATAYGPPPPPVPPVPGGFVAVVTSVTIGPHGGTIRPVRVGVLLVSLRVPSGAVPIPVQITLTAPDVEGIGDAGFPGFDTLGGVGVQVQQNGAPYPGVYLKPFVLDLAAASISRHSLVVNWNGTRFVTDPTARLASQSAQVTFDTAPEDFAVLDPEGPIKGATTAATGKPLWGEGILAGALLLLGTGGLAAAGRRRVGR